MADFEKGFDLFIEEQVNDDVNEAIFRLTRRAYLCGWLAAGGDDPGDDGVIRLDEYR